MNPRTVVSFATIALLIAVGVASAEGGFQLHLFDRVITREVATSIMVPVKCDLEGNTIVRVHREEIGGGSPILRIDPNGSVLASFTLDSTEFAEAQLLDFTPGSNGEIYVLVEVKPQEAHILEFDSRGKYVSHHQLESPLFARQIAVLSSGDFIVAGITNEEDAKPGKRAPKPFLGIFNNRGQLQKVLELKQDVQVRTSKSGSAARSYKDALAASSLQASDDGNAYLMRRSARGPIYQISPGGIVSRRTQLDPPPGAQLSNIRVSRNKLIAEFIKNKPNSYQIDSVLLQVIDLTNGQKADYWHSDPKIGSLLGCSSAGGMFSFISNDEEHYLTLVNAK